MSLRHRAPGSVPRLHPADHAGLPGRDRGHRQMKRDPVATWLVRIYLVLFFGYLFLPLIVMGAATFNTSRFPTVTPWLGTTLQWFVELYRDGAMWTALWTSVVIAAGVIAVSVPVGLAAALLLTSLQARARSFAYGVMVSPLLMPGVLIGISTLIFWQRFGVSGGIVLSILDRQDGGEGKGVAVRG